MPRSFLFSALLLFAPIVTAASAADIERGRYLVRISGCNDCHTPGYLQHNGEVP
jgi:mono/diheme cytochrome c family protein